jgi:hypothetical protein
MKHVLVAVEKKKEEDDNNQQLTYVTNPVCHIPPFIFVVFCSMLAANPRFDWISRAFVSFFIVQSCRPFLPLTVGLVRL